MKHFTSTCAEWFNNVFIWFFFQYTVVDNLAFGKGPTSNIVFCKTVLNKQWDVRQTCVPFHRKYGKITQHRLAGLCPENIVSTFGNIGDLAQDCSNSIANTLEILQSCTKPSILSYDIATLRDWHLRSHINFQDPSHRARPSYMEILTNRLFQYSNILQICMLYIYMDLNKLHQKMLQTHGTSTPITLQVQRSFYKII